MFCCYCGSYDSYRESSINSVLLYLCGGHPSTMAAQVALVATLPDEELWAVAFSEYQRPLLIPFGLHIQNGTRGGNAFLRATDSWAIVHSLAQR